MDFDGKRTKIQVEVEEGVSRWKLPKLMSDVGYVG